MHWESSVSRLYQLKLKELEKCKQHLEELEEEYDAISEEQGYTEDRASLKRIERKQTAHMKKMQKVAEKCDRLEEELNELKKKASIAAISEPLQALVQVLTPVSFDIITKAYQASVSGGRQRQLPETLSSLVQRLNEIPGEPNAAKPMERFVRALIQERSLNPEQQQALQEWANTQGFASKVPEQQEDEETCLMVKVEPRSLNDASSGYLLSVVLVKYSDSSKPGAELIATPISVPKGTNANCTPGHSKEELPHILGEIIARCGREHRIALTDLVVQCFLPIQLMSLPIEHGQIPISPNQKQFIGARCRAVIVRSYDRHFFSIYDLAREDWRKYWERFSTCSESKCAESLTLLKPVDGKTEINWRKSKVVGCKFEEHHDQQQQEALWERLLGQGVPIALWSRQLGADQLAVKRAIQSATQCTIARLPTTLAEQRGRALSQASETDSLRAAPLCLLVDNPFRPFPTIEYQSA